MVLDMFKFFTHANEFFKDLGYNVVMSHVSNEETIQLSQQYAQGETCYPVKLVYRHMMQLAQQKVDYIFLPNILLSKGYKVMTLGYIPGMSLDISGDYPNMYWPFGDYLLAGAKLIAKHPNLYAVYLTNHGCGPDTPGNHMFREAMGDKPYL